LCQSQAQQSRLLEADTSNGRLIANVDCTFLPQKCDITHCNINMLAMVMMTDCVSAIKYQNVGKCVVLSSKIVPYFSNYLSIYRRNFHVKSNRCRHTLNTSSYRCLYITHAYKCVIVT